ncbi:hypothetical protein AB0J72_58060 [Dactylosporangium sp. NPDC049742]|uniref:hypothetical protein n=1 Tax=Dactylosporangium sp. NPDC049742 TaxID=3154737 RepID=UPI00343BE231
MRIIRRGIEQGIQSRYDVAGLVEWLRWLRADVSSQDVDGFVGRVMRLIAADAPVRETAVAILTEFAARLGMTLDEVLTARR